MSFENRQQTSRVEPARSKAAVNTYTDWIHRGLADLGAGVKKSPAVERMIREAAAAKGIAIPKGLLA